MFYLLVWRTNTRFSRTINKKRRHSTRRSVGGLFVLFVLGDPRLFVRMPTVYSHKTNDIEPSRGLGNYVRATLDGHQICPRRPIKSARTESSWKNVVVCFIVWTRFLRQTENTKNTNGCTLWFDYYLIGCVQVHSNDNEVMLCCDFFFLLLYIFL